MTGEHLWRSWPICGAAALAGLLNSNARVCGTNRISNELHEDAITRQADLIQLEQIASGYPSRERFLTELTLDPPDATSDQVGRAAAR